MIAFCLWRVAAVRAAMVSSPGLQLEVPSLTNACWRASKRAFLELLDASPATSMHISLSTPSVTCALPACQADTISDVNGQPNAPRLSSKPLKTSRRTVEPATGSCSVGGKSTPRLFARVSRVCSHCSWVLQRPWWRRVTDPFPWWTSRCSLKATAIAL